jgi:polyphosphate kinase 2 (PPK2 family)
VPESVWRRRYAAINAFERRLAATGVTIVKCFLHVSRDVQAQRLAARLDDPSKLWKYNPGDVDERMLWPDYQAAYADALRRCHTVAAPWYVVPSDRKWYRNWAVAALLAEALESIDPRYPPADFDVATEKRRLAES